MKKVFRSLFTFFMQGALITVPVALTIIIFFNAIRWIDGLLPFHIPIKISDGYTFELPGLGILSIMLGVTILGYITTRFVRNPVLYYIDNFFESTPLLKIVYTSIKDLIAAFVGEKKRFNHPVLVMVDKEAQVQRIGFVTQDDLGFLGIPQGKVAVYLPFSYGFNGQLVIVPVANISPINASGTEMMKFIISGGVTDVENN